MVELGDGRDLAGLGSLVHHVRTFWDRRHEPNVHLFHYADLESDLAGQMRRLAGILGTPEPDERLVAAATFEAMKHKADLMAPDTTHGIWQDTTRFFHHGRSGRWRDVVGAEADGPRYHERVAAMAPPDLVAWLHGRSLP